MLATLLDTEQVGSGDLVKKVLVVAEGTDVDARLDWEIDSEMEGDEVEEVIIWDALDSERVDAVVEVN